MNVLNILRKNKALKGLHAGKRCFIVANGPSIQHQNLLLLQDEIKIVVSYFNQHAQCKAVHPDYWVMADPRVWQDPPRFLHPLLQAIQQKEIVTKLFLPISGMLGQQYPLCLETFYFMYDAAKGIEEDIDFSQGIPPYGQNVVLITLMLAFYLGCNPIYLLGCDHSWWGWKREDYTDKRLPHFYKSLFSPMSDRISYDDLHSTILVQQFQYLKLLQYAAKRGVQIFNATAGGYLDLFPRVDYEDLFPGGSKPIDTKDVLSAIPDISSVLGKSAIKLINEGQLAPALLLLDEAIAQNTGRASKVEGLDYLRSICLMGLGEHRQAIQAARQDYLCNKPNRENTAVLLRALGEIRD